MTLREFKVWGGKRKEKDSLYIWAKDADDAIGIARLTDQSICISQWTGNEKSIESLPSAQPERKKGKWIPVTGIYKVTDEQFPNTHIEWVDATEPDEIDGVRCSECGTVYDFIEARNWCSECGARMER